VVLNRGSRSVTSPRPGTSGGLGVFLSWSGLTLAIFVCNRLQVSLCMGMIQTPNCITQVLPLSFF